MATFTFVLSVILAGTLAMGMTPAASLATQSLDPVQAFAEDVVTVTINITNPDDEEVTEGVAGTDYTVSFTATAADPDIDGDTPEDVASQYELWNGPTKVTGASTTVSAEGSYTFYVTAKDAADTSSAVKSQSFEIKAAQTTDPGEDGDDNEGDGNEGGGDQTVTKDPAIGSLNLVVTAPSATGTQTISESNPAKITVAAAGTPADLAAAVSKALTDFEGQVKVADGATPLEAGSYTVSAANGYITIAGVEGKYSGSVQYPYTLVYTFGVANVTTTYDSDSPFTFNTTSQVPAITVVNPATGQKAESGYTIKYQQTVEGVTTNVAAPTNAGSYTAVVTWDGYPAAQKVEVPFEISKKELQKVDGKTGFVTLSKIDNLAYTGDEIAVPSVTVTANWGTATAPRNVVLTEDTDYEVTILKGNGAAQDETFAEVDEIEGVGNYQLQITGIGNYSGELVTNTFAVEGIDIADADIVIENADDLVISNPAEGDAVKPVTPEIKVTYGDKELELGTDYTISPTVEAISEPVQNLLYTITGIGDYAGTATTTVNVLRSVDFATSTAPQNLKYGDTNAKNAPVTVTYKGSLLKEGVDYSIAYGANTGAGPQAGSYTITGIGNGWGGTLKGTYPIAGTTAEIRNLVVDKNIVFDGTVQDAADFITFDVYAENANKQMVKVDASAYDYEVRVNREFKNAGTYSYTIQLLDCPYDVSKSGTDEASDASDKAAGEITIKAADLSELTVTPSQETYLVTLDKTKNPAVALPINPEYIVTLNGAEYTLTANDFAVAYKNAATNADVTDLTKAAGTISATLTGSNNFTSSKVVEFDVYKNIANLYPNAIADVTYNGEAQTPAVVLLEEENTPASALPEVEGIGNAATTNYSISYVDNINAGTGKVVVTGTPELGSAYAGTLEIPFTINKAAGTIEVADIADATYTGYAITPEPTATIKAGTATVDSTFAYSYTNNVNAGEATVTVIATGAGDNYDVAPVSKTFKIAAADIAKATYAGETTVAVGKQPAVKFTFNGKELVAGTDYKVVATPIVSKEGKATLTVEGLGNFAGTKTVTITVSNATKPVDPDKPVNPDKPGTETKTGWVKNDTGWWYNEGTSYPTNTWKAIGGAWYHFNSAGYVETGWVNDNGTWYYCNTAADGVEGKMVANTWKFIDGRWFYFNANGSMATGWKNVGGTWYLLNTQHDGSYGAMLTGWQRVDHATGAPTTANSWYYLNPVGGALATSTWVGNYYVDSTGYWVY